VVVLLKYALRTSEIFTVGKCSDRLPWLLALLHDTLITEKAPDSSHLSLTQWSLSSHIVSIYVEFYVAFSKYDIGENRPMVLFLHYKFILISHHKKFRMISIPGPAFNFKVGSLKTGGNIVTYF